MGRTIHRIAVLAGALAALSAAPAARGEDVEARVSLDVREAPVESIVSLLVELGGRQVVFDPGLQCSLTLKVHQAPWHEVLETSLRACGLGHQEEGGVLWVAPVSRLRQESESRRRLRESRPSTRGDLALHRLSYARAEEMAPLLQRFVAPEGSVTVDARTNTLIIRY
jgi:type II secretory pathway component HofQ